MADADIEGLAAAAQATDQGQPKTDATANNLELAQRVRGWFLEAWNHPLWVKFRREAKEDMGFYVGGDGQWSVDGSTQDLATLKAAKRAHVSINHVQSIVDVLTGFERQNRYDLKAAPEGEEDAEDANLMTLLMKHEQEQMNAHAQMSELFEDGCITGAKVLEVAIDWTADPVNGEICLEQNHPGVDVLWDPFSLRQDFRDARYLLKFKHAFLDDIIAENPDHREALMLAASATPGSFGSGGETLAQGDPRDGYGSVGNRPAEPGTEMFWSPAEKKVMVIEAWYRDYEDVHLVVDKASGQTTKAETRQEALATAAADPDKLTAVRRKQRLIKMGVVLPAFNQTLEEDETPYGNDKQEYPFVAFIAKHKGEDLYGVVRNLKDPQRIENRRESQGQDILGRYGNIRPIVEEQSLVTPTTLDDPWATGPIHIRPGKQPPSWFVPPLAEVLRVLFSSGDRGKLSMREVSGINTDLLGMKGDDASGIAIARRQAQGQIISTVFFDNFRQAKRFFGRRMGKRIQQVYSYEKTIRLTGPDGNDMTLHLNPPDARGKTKEEFVQLQQARATMDERRPKVLRDVTALEFDVVIAETPATPSMRAMALLALLEIVGKIPGIAPAVMDIIIELSDIPDRAKVLERVRALMAGMGVPGAPGGQPPTPASPPTPPLAGAGTPPAPGTPRVLGPPPGAAPAGPPGGGLPGMAR